MPHTTALPAAHPVPQEAMQWDIFCAVIDNYGDIGVCWRLARQLAHEHAQRVRLWVDDLQVFARLCPEIDPACAQQDCQGIVVRHWPRQADFPAVTPARVVVEAFACELPEAFVAAMARQTVAAAAAPAATPAPRRWINLEYLSAEAWVAGCHGMASPHPRWPLTKYFFFPGFAPPSGGLLRESGLAAARAQFDPGHWWSQHAGFARPPAGLKVSLFAYPNPGLAGLLAAWQQIGAGCRSGPAAAITCLIPESPLATAAAGLLGMADRPGARQRRGGLTVQIQPLVAQPQFDPLLWACDLNLVRGEDSLVRSLWAAKPMIWHIYPQADAAHLPKLEAFIAHYCTGLAAPAAAAWAAFTRAWNLPATTGTPDWPRLTADLLAALPELQRHSARHAARLATWPDLACQLLEFTQGAASTAPPPPPQSPRPGQ